MAPDLAAQILRLAAPLTPAPATLEALSRASRVRVFAKGQHLARQGDRAAGLFFIRSGLVRYYYLADGVEHTGQFFDEGKIVGDVFALTQQAPGLQNFDALEDCEVVLLPVEALNAAYDADHALERFGRRLVEEAMSGSQRRTASFLQLSPEERYTRFVATRPEIFRRVPQFLTASYLGITPEALSRIRGRRRKPGDEPL